MVKTRFGIPGQESLRDDNQHTSTPASQHTGKPAKEKRTGKHQQASKPVKQHTSKTAKQHAGKTVGQQTGKTTSQPIDIRVKRHAGKLTKATFYIYPEQIIDLEKIRLNHLTTKKNKTDKSALVRQAISMLVDQHTSKPVASKEV